MHASQISLKLHGDANFVATNVKKIQNKDEKHLPWIVCRGLGMFLKQLDQFMLQYYSFKAENIAKQQKCWELWQCAWRHRLQLGLDCDVRKFPIQLFYNPCTDSWHLCEKSQPTLYRKSWVFSGYSGFLPQGMLTGWVGIIPLTDPSTVAVLRDQTWVIRWLPLAPLESLRLDQVELRPLLFSFALSCSKDD
jgi:hypothetical protein